MPRSPALSSLSPFTLPFAAAVLALALGACDKADRPETTAVATEAGDLAARKAAFEQEVTDLKAKGLAPDRMNLALAEARVRHGFPLPANAVQDPITAGAAALPGALQGALPKTASTISKFALIRTATFGFVPTVTVDVPANATLEARTTHPGAEDPMLVGFYLESDLGSSRYTTRDIGLSDDHNGGTDAYFSWTNTTGTRRSINLVAFAFAPSLTGQATIIYRVVGGVRGSWTMDMDAAQANTFDNPPAPAGCAGPTMSLLNLYRVWGQESEYALLAVNATTHRGGWSFVTADLTRLEDILPRNYDSFILAYKIIDPSSRFFEESGYRAEQVDVYSCPN